MEEYLPMIIQLVTGAGGGVVAGKLLKNLSLGTIGNALSGIVGGGIGGQIIGMLTAGAGAATGIDASSAVDAVAGGMDLSGILSNVAGGGVGGGVVMAIIGLIKKAISK